MMVVWDFDDLKVYHMEILHITKLSGYLSRIYGGFTDHRVKVHDYLDMDIDYNKKILVYEPMIKYLNSVLKECLYQMGVTSATPSVNQCLKL